MVLEEFRAPLVSRERPIPTPGADEAVIRVGACGVCRTDLKIWTGTHPAIKKLPHVLGHEVTGRFVAVGYNPVDPFHVNSQILVSRELEIYGSRACGRSDLKETIDLVSNAKVKPFVGEAYPLSEANVALDKLERGDLVGRLVLVPGKI